MRKRIGIVGGGQLGRMIATDAIRMGFDVTVLDSVIDAPAKQVGADQIVGGLKDAAAIRKLVKISDFITVEIEHINTEALEKLEKAGASINPSPKTLDMIKDKLQQKQFLRDAGVAVADFLPVDSEKDVEQVVKEFSFPFLLKSRFGGYDGRGNALIKTKRDIKKTLEKFGNQPLYAERFVPFEKELAIMAARGLKGEIVTYPVVQTIHKNNICHTVIAPAPVSKKAYQQAEEFGRDIMQHLRGAGVFGIEMFYTKNGKILVNEIAPRVHNSGHYTIEATITPQFEQHVRAITGLPLGSTEMKVPAAVMVNILGDRTGEAKVTGLEKALKIPGVAINIYGKKDTKPERKMGHITAVGKTVEEAYNRATKARKLISI